MVHIYASLLLYMTSLYVGTVLSQSGVRTEMWSQNEDIFPWIWSHVLLHQPQHRAKYGYYIVLCIFQCIRIGYLNVALSFSLATIPHLGRFNGDLEQEKLQIEQHFMHMKEEKMNNLLDRLNLQERMRMDDMIDKQSREMLQLIDKKVILKVVLQDMF